MVTSDGASIRFVWKKLKIEPHWFCFVFSSTLQFQTLLFLSEYSAALNTNYDQIWPNNFLICRHCVASGSNYMLPPRSSASILLVTEGQGEQVVFNKRFVCLLITTFQRQVSNTQCSETWFYWSTSSIGIRRILNSCNWRKVRQTSATCPLAVSCSFQQMQHQKWLALRWSTTHGNR